MMDRFARGGRCCLAAAMVVALLPVAAFGDEPFVESAVPSNGESDIEVAADPTVELSLALGAAPMVEPSIESSVELPSEPASEVPAASAAADSDVITVQARPHGLNRDEWSATVSYVKPVAGAPAGFTITADGGPKGSGSYQYQQGFIYKYDPAEGRYVWVYDPSFGRADPYQDSNVLSYQFVSAGRYQYQFQVRDTVTNLFQRFTFDITVDGDGFIDVETRAREIVDECLPDGSSDDYETALALHDWIIDNVSYDYSYKHLGIDRALAGMAVTCEGYHAAYVKLLEVAGLEAGRITDGGHVWTAVKMDGAWYHVDTTHDDVKDDFTDPTTPGFLTREQQAHLLFGLDDVTMMLANPSYEGPTQGYEATSLENNYFIKTGDIMEWSDSVADQILQRLERKETSFTLEAPNAHWAQDSYKDVINNLVAYELNQYEWITDGQAADAVVRVSYADDYFTVKTYTVLVGEPTVARNLVYNGASQKGVTVPSTGSYALRGTTSAVDAGAYTVWAAPGDGYAWDKSGSVMERPYRWTIAPASIAGVSVTGLRSSYEYAGSPIRPEVTVRHGGRTLREGVDYRVSYENNSRVGKATLTIQGSGKNYTGSRKLSFNIVAPKNAWVTAGGKTYYYDGAGKPVKWSQKIGGAWYYFNGSGVMQTGWITWKDGTKSYFDWDGKALTGWRSFSGVKYYFDPSTGISKRWSQKIDGKWYYFDSSSRMARGWITWKDGTKSYFHPDAKGHAAALLGWRSFNGVKYYFDPSTGISKRWSQRLGGYWYYFDSASRMKAGWVTWKDGRKSYFNWDGKALTGWRSFNGVKYYFDPVTGMTR